MSDCKIKHTPGPWEYEKIDGAAYSMVSNGDVVVAGIPNPITEYEQSEWPISEGNGKLVALAPTAPHECDDPKCPGNVNRRKLEAWNAMISVAKEISQACRGNLPGIGVDIARLISWAEAIEKGE